MRKRRLGAVTMAALAVVVLSACNTAVFRSKGMPPAERELAAEEASADTGSGGRDEDEKAITEVFVWFFDGPALFADGAATDDELEAKAAKVYNVTNIKQTLIDTFKANANVFSMLAAKVENIEFKGKDRAEVTFTLMVGGEPTLPGAVGNAIREDGVWKLDAQLTCDLVALADASAPCDPGPPPGT
ncbi:MAG: hypothetical protein DYH08_07205 [Actinobacteria bacterium ATB1]|nr:hypothetical protein [Actinobacteria bacterium ATB1]